MLSTAGHNAIYIMNEVERTKPRHHDRRAYIRLYWDFHAEISNWYRTVFTIGEAVRNSPFVVMQMRSRI